MQQSVENSYKTLYNNISSSHSGLILLDEKDIEMADSIVKKYDISIKKNDHFVSTSTALILFLTFPSLVSYFFIWLQSAQMQLQTLFNIRTIFDNFAYLHVSLFLYSISIIVYFYPKLFIYLNNVFNALNISVEKRNYPKPFINLSKTLNALNNNIKKRNELYSLFLHINPFYRYTLTYFSISVPFIYYYSYCQYNIIDIIFFSWLFIPLIVVSLSPAMLYMISIIFLQSLRNKNKTTSPQIISYKLLQLLEILSEVKNLVDLRKHVNSITFRIIEISNDIRDLKLNHSKSYSISWSTEEFKKASLVFISLISWVSFPQKSTIISLRSELINYFNIIAKCDFHELPRIDSNNIQGIKHDYSNTSLMRILLIVLPYLIYVIFPIVFLFFLHHEFHISLDNDFKSLFYLFYIVWVTFGLIILFEKTNLNSKTTIVNLLKYFINK